MATAAHLLELDKPTLRRDIMPWYISKTNGQLEKASSSPGSTWIAIIGSTDSMTKQQALQTYVQGVANAEYGTQFQNPATSAKNTVENTLSSWLTGLGGDIGSGLEAGFVALLQDVWNVILGPLEIIAGALLAGVILLWIFKDDLASLSAIVA
jgi:hypothetical protein